MAAAVVFAEVVGVNAHHVTIPAAELLVEMRSKLSADVCICEDRPMRQTLPVQTAANAGFFLRHSFRE